MPNTKSKTNATEPDKEAQVEREWRAARAARELAEHAHAEAQAATLAAGERYGALLRKIEAGDLSITEADLAAAERAPEFAQAREYGALAALSAAKEAEAPLVAQVASARAVDRSAGLALDSVRDAQAKAVAIIADALVPVIGATVAHRDVYLDTAAMLDAAATGDRPTRYTVPLFGIGEAVYVNTGVGEGDTLPTVTPTEAVLDVLRDAVSARGFDLDGALLREHQEPAAPVHDAEAEALERERIAELADWYAPSERLIVSPQR